MTTFVGPDRFQAAAGRFVPFFRELEPSDVRRQQVRRMRAPSARLRGLGEAEIMVYPLRRSRCRAPLLRLPDAEELLLVDLMVETPGSGAARRCAGFRASYERLRDRGATLYPIGSLELDRDGWRRHYGEAWDAFAAARARHVPDGRLGPGPGIFA